MFVFDEKAVIERIKALRNRYAGPRGKGKFAQALGISLSTYSYYENNRIPPIETLLRICEVTNTDLNWLLTGKKTQADTKKSTSGADEFSTKQNVSLLRSLDGLLEENPDLVKPITAFVELLCEKKGIEKTFHSKNLPTVPQRPGWIPILGRTAAGIVYSWDQTLLTNPAQAVTELEELVKKQFGKTIIDSQDGTVLIDLQARLLVEGLKTQRANLIQVGDRGDQQIVEFIQCEEIHRLFPDSFALRIDGDSMSPRINDGDIVVISPSVPAAEGHIAVVRVTNQIGVTCKLIRSTETEVHLVPINERYEPKAFAKKDLVWALAVLCHISV
jgi:transcriptional regulator with XRE-family HTH domain